MTHIIPTLVAGYLLEGGDEYKDGWLLDQIIPRIACLSRAHRTDQVQQYLTKRRTTFQGFVHDAAEDLGVRVMSRMALAWARREWRLYNADYEWRARSTASTCIRGSCRPLLSWGVGSVHIFLAEIPREPVVRRQAMITSV